MAAELSENMGKRIHQIGRERQDRIISGETKLTVASIFLIDDNCETFKEASDGKSYVDPGFCGTILVSVFNGGCSPARRRRPVHDV